MEPSWLDTDEINVIQKAITLLDDPELSGLTYNLARIIGMHSEPKYCNRICSIVNGRPYCQRELGHVGLHEYGNNDLDFRVTWGDNVRPTP